MIGPALCDRFAPTYNGSMDDEDSTPMQFPDPVPAELAGKWVAWDEEALHIVGSGETMEEAIASARTAGVTEPFLDKVPLYPFIGRA
jgi:hypothetical protein